MANIIVAGLCNLHCTYCFASDYLQAVSAHSGTQFISLEAFEARLDFIDRSGITDIRLIGGEPTLHPQFAELVRRAQLRRKHLVVFSHGLLSEQALSILEDLTADEVTILINLSASRHPNGPDDQELDRRRVVLQRLGQRALPGCNIVAPSARLDGLLPLIQDTGCRKRIRLGLAQPSLSGQNRYLHPKQYPRAGQQIVRLASAAREAGVTLEFDCGFVRCMFSDHDLEMLRAAGANFGWHCNPILDINQFGQVLHCFPLAVHVQVPFTATAVASDLRQALVAQTRAYRSAGIYRECSGCRFKRNGECPGGCLANTMRRFQHTPVRLVVPAAGGADSKKKTLPADVSRATLESG